MVRRPTFYQNLNSSIVGFDFLHKFAIKKFLAALYFLITLNYLSIIFTVNKYFATTQGAVQAEDETKPPGKFNSSLDVIIAPYNV